MANSILMQRNSLYFLLVSFLAHFIPLHYFIRLTIHIVRIKICRVADAIRHTHSLLRTLNHH